MQRKLCKLEHWRHIRTLRHALLMLVMLLSVKATATHFRGGTITWQPNGGNNIQFTLTTSWRRGYFINNGYTPTVGSFVPINLAGDGFYFGDNQSITSPMSAQVTSEDVTNDIVTTTYTVNHLYATTGNYVVNALNSCCRIAAIPGNNNQAPYNLQTVVNVGNFSPANHPPVSSMTPVVNVPFNATGVTFTIPGFDPDGDNITFRLSNPGVPANATAVNTGDQTHESGLVAQNPGLSIASNGTVTINTTAANGYAVGSYYAVQAIVEDRTPTNIVKSKAPVDFLLFVVASSQAPTFVSPTPLPPNNTFTVIPGSTLSFTVKASDADPLRKVTLNPVSVPAGAVMFPSLPTTGLVGGSISSTFTWTPTAAQKGGYSITFSAITDLGMQTTTSVSITVPCALSAIGSVSPASCAGKNNGAIALTPTDFSSISNLHYSWTGAGSFTGTTKDISALIAGTYNVRIDDAGTGCFTTKSFTVGEPTQVTASASKTDASCFGGSNGSVSVNASGGTGALSYAWSPNTTNTASSATGLSAGTYTVTVTDANGCASNPATVSATVGQPTQVIASASKTDASCFGGTNGSVTVNASGGTGALSYAWTPNVSSTSSATGLSAGTYSIVVTDANECASNPATVSAIVGQPTQVTASASKTDASCYGGSNGSVTVTASGGTGALSYAWSPNTTNTTSTATGLAAGTYTVTVTDANGCASNPATVSATVGQPTQVIASASKTDASCFGGSNGSVTVNASGGTGALSYAWSPNTTNTTSSATGLSAGTYSIVVTDANGCASNPATVSATVGQPTQVIASASKTDASCFGGSNGSVTVNASGGTGALSYAWSPNTTNTASSATGLSAGTYTVTVTDANGCASNPATVSAIVGQPTQVTASASKTDASCYGGTNGTVSVNASGGTGALSYAWSPNVSSTSSATGLSAGTYSIVVTDANGCASNPATVSATVGQPTQLAVAVTSQTDVLCYGNTTGAINITASGGTPNYSYNWGTTTSEDRSNLAAGTYTVTVTDAHGCTKTASATITQPTAPLAVTEHHTNVSCYAGTSGSITVQATGGTLPYQYSKNGGSYQTSNVFGALTAGSYVITVKDAHNCTISTASVTISQPASSVSASIANTNTFCSQNTIYVGYGPSSLTLSVSAGGGTPGYSYLWSTGSTTSSATVSPSVSNVYSVTVKDANQCSITKTITVSVKDVRCGNNNDKVMVCHNGNNAICISPNAVPTHITNHGDCLGDCSSAFAKYVATGNTQMNLEEGKIIVFPNPASGKINVELKEMGAAYQYYQITDINGRVLIAKELGSDIHSDLISIDISNLVPGIYIIRAVTSNGANLTKFTVQ